MFVQFYDAVDDAQLRFAVVLAKSGGKWVFCRHRLRNTFEVPGGHRESGETILEAAVRELREETGALDFMIQPICAYSVTGKNRVNQTGEETFGMLYCAEIHSFSPELHSEMQEVCLFSEIPENLTYPEIQPKLIAEAQRRNAI